MLLGDCLELLGISDDMAADGASEKANLSGLAFSILVELRESDSVPTDFGLYRFHDLCLRRDQLA